MMRWVETSLSFTAWTQRAGLLRALEMLLAQGMPVTTVAIDLGYSSVSAFIALFKRNFGVTPSVYFDRSATRAADHAARRATASVA